jgi:hypothetical protein
VPVLPGVAVSVLPGVVPPRVMPTASPTRP